MNNSDISDIRTAIFNRDKNKCYYCNASGPGTELHLDHVLPKSIFHLHSVYNLITACKSCNFGRGAELLSDKQYNKLFEYLLKANIIFSIDIIKIYSKRLTVYYTKKPKHIKLKEEGIINKNSIAYTQGQIKQNEQFLRFQETKRGNNDIFETVVGNDPT
jgi:HNH endonuclease.